MRDVDDNDNLVRLAKEEIEHQEEIQEKLDEALDLFKDGLGGIEIFDRVELPIKFGGSLITDYDDVHDAIAHAHILSSELATDLAMCPLEELKAIFRKKAIRGHLKLVK